MTISPPEPLPVRLAIGLSSAEPALIDELTGRLVLEFGQVLFRSERHAVAGDGGPGHAAIRKEWLALAEPIDPAALARVKRHTLRVEQLYLAPGGGRRVRLDTVYVDPHRVVRGVEADAPHRIYLGSGIYGEVALLWTPAGGFEPMPWTGEDDSAHRTLDFFEMAREDLILKRKQAGAA